MHIAAKRLLREREIEKREIEARLATTPVAKPAAAIPSASILLRQFGGKLADLFAWLDAEGTPAEAAGIVGRLIERVTIHPHGEHGPEAEVEADLLPRNHAIGKLARQMETSDAARPFYRGSDHSRAA